MDFSELKGKATEFFSNLKTKISDFVAENKILSIIISAMAVLIILCIILIAIVAGKKKNKVPDIPAMALEISTPQVIPNGPELPRSYNLYRESEEEWSEEDGRQWFTTPTEKEISSLSTANENMVNDIIEAAP
ncbi:MAG: hypothetical protein PUC37_08875 [Spirochaetales bacterium]|nr:hypothetical protein [Spirochaetales bacterium]